MTPTRAILTAVALCTVLTACPSSGGSISGLKILDVGGAGDHRAGLISYDPAKYGLPPAGGPHNARWMQCGVYDRPIASEFAVHSLEHGAVWIVYNQDLPPAELDKLKAAVQGVSYALLSPYPRTINAEPVPQLPTPIVVSAWGVQKGYDSASDEIKTFLSSYANGPASKAPERGALCGGPNAILATDERAG